MIEEKDEATFETLLYVIREDKLPDGINYQLGVKQKLLEMASY
jgi:hypothetical protein